MSTSKEDISQKLAKLQSLLKKKSRQLNKCQKLRSVHKKDPVVKYGGNCEDETKLLNKPTDDTCVNPVLNNINENEATEYEKKKEDCEVIAEGSPKNHSEKCDDILIIKDNQPNLKSVTFKEGSPDVFTLLPNNDETERNELKDCYDEEIIPDGKDKDHCSKLTEVPDSELSDDVDMIEDICPGQQVNEVILNKAMETDSSDLNASPKASESFLQTSIPFQDTDGRNSVESIKQVENLPNNKVVHPLNLFGTIEELNSNFKHVSDDISNSTESGINKCDDRSQIYENEFSANVYNEQNGITEQLCSSDHHSEHVENLPVIQTEDLFDEQNIISNENNIFESVNKTSGEINELNIEDIHCDAVNENISPEKREELVSENEELFTDNADMFNNNQEQSNNVKDEILFSNNSEREIINEGMDSENLKEDLANDIDMDHEKDDAFNKKLLSDAEMEEHLADNPEGLKNDVTTNDTAISHSQEDIQMKEEEPVIYSPNNLEDEIHLEQAVENDRMNIDDCVVIRNKVVSVFSAASKDILSSVITTKCTEVYILTASKNSLELYKMSDDGKTSSKLFGVASEELISASVSVHLCNLNQSSNDSSDILQFVLMSSIPTDETVVKITLVDCNTKLPSIETTSVLLKMDFNFVDMKCICSPSPWTIAIAYTNSHDSSSRLLLLELESCYRERRKRRELLASLTPLQTSLREECEELRPLQLLPRGNESSLVVACGYGFLTVIDTVLDTPLVTIATDGVEHRTVLLAIKCQNSLSVLLSSDKSDVILSCYDPLSIEPKTFTSVCEVSNRCCSNCSSISSCCISPSGRFLSLFRCGCVRDVTPEL